MKVCSHAKITLYFYVVRALNLVGEIRIGVIGSRSDRIPSLDQLISSRRTAKVNPAEFTL